MMKKKQNRLRRAAKTRAKIKQLGMCRLTVHRTSQHIYAQVLSADGGSVIAAASTMQAGIRKDVKNTGNVEAAVLVGKAVAEKAQAKGLANVAFDRSGFQYHGRVKALADAAREAGLQF